MINRDPVLAELADFFRWTPPSWIKAAACRTKGYRPSWWMRNGKKKLDMNLREKAKDICIYECQVRWRCLARFMDEEAGIFGGMDEEERKALWDAMPYYQRADPIQVQLKVGRRSAKEERTDKAV